MDLHIRRCGCGFHCLISFPLLGVNMPLGAKQTPSMWPYFRCLGTLNPMPTLFPYIRTMSVKYTYKDLAPLLRLMISNLDLRDLYLLIIRPICGLS